MILAAHQNAFLPWLGYLHKMASCDVFVLMDGVQFPRANYVNRVQVKLQQGAHWLTLPVIGSRDTTIGEMRVAEPARAADTICKTLQRAYARSPHRDPWLGQLQALLVDTLRGEDLRLVEAVDPLLAWTCERFAIAPRIVRQSELGVSGHKNELLLAMCLATGADVYLSGRVAAKEYLQPSVFESRGVSVRVQEFTHPRYPQLHGDFVPGLSSLDALLNCGEEAARALVHGASSG